ncbi:hypothetical protein ACH47B_35495 [Rhodococcus sp. NPDC019627]|uniref:hypothetical protein n=1 Tax=unclassified Rhodococcus (in: high G+C Gram-positive bacteria) TaxID=192944 RepID=UPI0033DF62B3
MIGPADDLMIHQTHEPVRFAGTSDRRFYDRHFLTGHSNDGEVFFMLGMGVYPNLGVIDTFASVAVGDTQWTTRASRELGVDRLDSTSVGPVDLEVLEGLRRLRFRVAPGEAVSLDLEWNGAVPAFEEPPLFSRVAGRVLEQGTRLIQSGRWTGQITVAGRRFDVQPDTWWGARDRSWGVRSIGLEREPKGIAQAHGLSAQRPPLWIWSPMQFEERTVHLIVSEHASGEREIETVRQVPTFTAGGSVLELSGPEHELKFDANRELLDGSSISFLEADGTRRQVNLEPLRRAYLRAGTGYGGPDPWRHGAYMGQNWVDSVSYDLSDESVTARIGPTHVLCRMTTDTGEIGYGTFETQIFGAFPRYGFTS